MKPEPAPVVTMDEKTLDMFVDGVLAGHVIWRITIPKPTLLARGDAFDANQLRAIADFLDQLEGANLDLPDGPPFVGLDWEVVAVPCEDCKFRFNLLHDLGEWADQLESDGGPGIFLAAEVRRRFLAGDR